MPLPNFKDEAEFRTTWITPFLTKLGYIVVTHSHGPDEQGKDFFFADFDRFEHLRFYAVQAKKGDIGAGDVEVGKLLDQVRRAFTVPIRDRRGGEVHYVSAVYIFASGKISDRAREYITAWCLKQPYGENVYFLDGERLDQLDRHAAHQTDQEIRRRLQGLWLETEFNLRALDSVESNLGVGYIAHDRCRNVAMGQALSEPLPANILDLAVVEAAWDWVEKLNQGLGANLLRAIPESSNMPEVAIPAALEEIKVTRDANIELWIRVLAAMKELDEKYEVTIEVLKEPP